MDNKKRNIVLTLIVLLAIGFASVSSVLVINGLLAIGENSDDFKIIFTSATIDGTRKDEVISESKTEISYETKVLSLIDEESTLEYEATNTSRNYDADVQIVCNIVDESENVIEGENEYVDMTYTPKSMELLAGETKQGSITAKLKKAVTEPMDINIKCTLTGTPKERDELGDEMTTTKVGDSGDEELNVPKPDFGNDKLIPINLTNDGTATVANIEEKWYDYKNKEWANAVILIDKPSKTYSVGETIKESDIESFFVWIPRYRYQIFDEGDYTSITKVKPIESNVKEIQIEFETKDTPPSTGTTKGSWLTHPVFTNFDVDGLWVGKYETGYKGATTSTIAQQCVKDSTKVVIQPNITSWRNNSPSNMFKTAYDYERELDSHMMKNTEWGAVAYLSHSKYGINGSININNNSSYLTGYSAVKDTSGIDETVTLPYNTEIGYKASTTGNITGVYDMSGGALEFVAGISAIGNSGLTKEEVEEYSKYLDEYPIDSTKTSYNNRILGDATGEMGPFYGNLYVNNWYNNAAYFVEVTKPWFARGGSQKESNYSGQFYFYNLNKSPAENAGFRLVLAPTN